MDFAGYLKKAIEIVKLNGSVAAEIAKDEQAFTPGLVFIAAGGLAAGISGLVFSHGHVGGVIGGPIMAVIGYFIGVGILHVVATSFFGGKGEYMELFRAEASASIIGWAALLPFIGALAGLWHLPVSVIILENVYQMPRQKAIATVAVIFGFFLCLGILMAFVFGAFLGAFLGGVAR